MQTKPLQIAQLPAPITRYFALQTNDSQVVARCFSEDAAVLDEGLEYQGRAAIAAWIEAAVAQYQFTAEPLSAESNGTQTTVIAQVSGNFPGSPVQLRFRFALAGDLIARLEIAP